MNDTQDLDIVEISKIVVKDVMVRYLFEPADEATFNRMEHDIAKGLVAYDIIFMNIDYDVDVEAVDGDVRVTIEIFGIGDTGSVKYIAKYVDCPVVSSMEAIEDDTHDLDAEFKAALSCVEDIEKDIVNSTFDDAMEIVK